MANARCALRSMESIMSLQKMMDFAIVEKGKKNDTT